MNNRARIQQRLIAEAVLQKRSKVPYAAVVIPAAVTGVLVVFRLMLIHMQSEGTDIVLAYRAAKGLEVLPVSPVVFFDLYAASIGLAMGLQIWMSLTWLKERQAALLLIRDLKRDAQKPAGAGPGN